MSPMASQITSLGIVYSTVYPGADQTKHQSSASLAFVRRIHRGPVNSPHKRPVTRKYFHLMASSCVRCQAWIIFKLLDDNFQSDTNMPIEVFHRCFQWIQSHYVLLPVAQNREICQISRKHSVMWGLYNIWKYPRDLISLSSCSQYTKSKIMIGRSDLLATLRLCHFV